MQIKILDEQVRHNIELFLNILHTVKAKQLSQPWPSEKIFKAWLNKVTGQLFFEEIAKESQILGQKEWKQVSLQLQYDRASGEIQFLLEEEGNKWAGFHGGDLAPSSYKVLCDTMKIFHQLSEQLRGPSSLETKIAVLSKLNVESELSHVDRNILLDTWHNADRMQAESLLMNRPIGTYLFRRDDYADILEKALEQQLGCKVKCFTLAYSKSEHQICEATLVHIQGTWLLYNDDPTLQLQQRFDHLAKLVASFKGDLKYPFYRD